MGVTHTELRKGKVYNYKEGDYVMINTKKRYNEFSAVRRYGVVNNIGYIIVKLLPYNRANIRSIEEGIIIYEIDLHKLIPYKPNDVVNNELTGLIQDRADEIKEIDVDKVVLNGNKDMEMKIDEYSDDEVNRPSYIGQELENEVNYDEFNLFDEELEDVASVGDYLKKYGKKLDKLLDNLPELESTENSEERGKYVLRDRRKLRRRQNELLGKRNLSKYYL